ncbi:MAG: EpsG family protein, partial [Oscillospiraceae bacterium]|nr:EpsG family protein [Oscillospiraceae bacterium]
MYAANLISVLVFSVMAERYRSRSPFNVKQNRRLPVMAFTIAVIASFQILAGFRFDVGTDYYNYSIIYSDIVNHGAEFISSDKIDIGFIALCKTLAVFTDKPFAMFFITALAINTLTVLELRRRSSSFWLSCLMFILTFCF